MGASLVKKIVIGGLAFIVVGLAVAFGPSLLTGFESTRNDVESFTESSLSTPVANGSANATTFTFTRPLIVANVGHVGTITTNGTGTITAVAATITTTSVNLTGFTDLVPRYVTVTYDYGTNQYYTGLATTVSMGPTLILLGFIIAVGIVAFMGIRMKTK